MTTLMTSDRETLELGRPRLEAPDISLVVSTIGRPAELKRLLESIRQELRSGINVELIVVDQSPGETTGTLEMLRTQELPTPCLYTRSSIGVSHGRNVGLAMATGTYVMFPDDDAWFSGDMLGTAIRHLSTHKETDGFCARLCTAEGTNSMLRWSPKPMWVTHRNHHRTSIGSVMVFRRSLALEVGGFDESMGPGAEGWYGSCEDADFLLRVIEHGASVWYDPDAVVHHRDSRDDGSTEAQFKSLAYGCGQGHMWRNRSIGWTWIVFLLIRRLGNSFLKDLRGRSDIGRVQRAWVRGAINGLIGRPPLELAMPTSLASTSSVGPTVAEFSKSFRWRVFMSGSGIVATFILTAIAARALPNAELALFYVLLASLSIGPIISRFGINTRAVQELGAARARDDWDLAVRLARRASLACLFPTLIFGPLIAIFMIAWSAETDFAIYALLASTIFITESIRLTYSDIFIGLGMPRWGALLAHQSRAIGVAVAVFVDYNLFSSSLNLERLMFITAIIGVSLAAVGHIKMWLIPFDREVSESAISIRAMARDGMPFLAVDLVAVLIARGDVWLATKAFTTDAAALYSTASVVAMQIFTPIGLANVALAPIAAGYLATGRGSELQRIVQRIMSVLAAVLIPVILIVVFEGEALLSLAYGDRFGAAQRYLAVLLAGNGAFVTLGMSSVVLVMAGRQRLATVISVGWLCVVVPVAVVAALWGGPLYLAVASSMATMGLVVGLALSAWITTGVRVYPTFGALGEVISSVRKRFGYRTTSSAAPKPRLEMKRSVWWLWPSAPVLLLAVPAAIFSLLVSEATYIRAWRTPKNIDLGTTLLFIAGLGALMVGLTLVSLGRRYRWQTADSGWGAMSSATVDLLEKAFRYLVGFSLFGYAAWLANGVLRGGLRPADFVTAVVAQNNEGLELRDKLPNIAGVTTLTQVAIIAVIVGVLVDINRPSAKVRWLYRSLLILGFVRAFLLSERLAFVEIIVPVVILRAANLMERGNYKQRLRVLAAPILGVVLILVMFGAAEYSRSWNFYSEARDQPFSAFVTERLIGYYATSYNNGALLVRNDPRNDEAPFHTVTFLWEAPAKQVGEAFPIGVNGSDIVRDAENRKRSLLHRKGNPEFNSPSGVAAPFVDYGYLGGAVFFLLVGVALGALHLSFVRGRLWGLLLYPIAFVGLLELPRYVYWVQGRATPALVAAAIVVFYAARNAAETLRSLPPPKPRPPRPSHRPSIRVPAAEIEVLTG